MYTLLLNSGSFFIGQDAYRAIAFVRAAGGTQVKVEIHNDLDCCAKHYATININEVVAFIEHGPRVGESANADGSKIVLLSDYAKSGI